MMSKLTVQGSSHIDHLNQRFINIQGEDNLGIIVIKIDIKIDTDQTVVIA